MTWSYAVPDVKKGEEHQVCPTDAYVPAYWPPFQDSTSTHAKTSGSHALKLPQKDISLLLICHQIYNEFMEIHPSGMPHDLKGIKFAFCSTKCFADFAGSLHPENSKSLCKTIDHVVISLHKVALSHLFPSYHRVILPKSRLATKAALTCWNTVTQCVKGDRDIPSNVDDIDTSSFLVSVKLELVLDGLRPSRFSWNDKYVLNVTTRTPERREFQTLETERIFHAYALVGDGRTWFGHKISP